MCKRWQAQKQVYLYILIYKYIYQAPWWSSFNRHILSSLLILLPVELHLILALNGYRTFLYCLFFGSFWKYSWSNSAQPCSSAQTILCLHSNLPTTSEKQNKPLTASRSHQSVGVCVKVDGALTPVFDAAITNYGYKYTWKQTLLSDNENVTNWGFVMKQHLQNEQSSNYLMLNASLVFFSISFK